MRKNLLMALLLFTSILKGQELINSYYNYSGLTPPDNLNLNSNHYFDFYYPTSSAFNSYTGEYELIENGLDEVWDAYYAQNNTGSLSYKIEVVSFPFTMDCAYDFPVGCADGGIERKMYMPDNIAFPFSLLTRKWGTGGALALETPFPGVFTSYGTYDETHQNLISTSYIGQNITSPVLNRTVLPHTILKHTYNLHCGSNPLTSPIAASVSCYVDNTRGRMNYYPFKATNSYGSNLIDYDICFSPEFIYLTPNNGGQDHMYSFSQKNKIAKYETLNYFPYTEIPAMACNGSSTFMKPQFSEFFGDGTNGGNSPFPAPYVLFSSPARKDDGKFLAGYNYVVGGTPTALPGIMHEYFIDKGFPDLDLNWINPSEKLIFNPSVVTVGPRAFSTNTNLVNLIFPHQYTFKTMLGVYPSVQEVNDANTASNGGPYADLRDVPVPVFANDGHIGDPNYPDLRTYDDPNNGFDDNWGNYIIEKHGKITIEECVKIFDANFFVEKGATLHFTNYPSCIIPETTTNLRVVIHPYGGAILRNYASIQNLDYTVVTQDQDYELKYIALNEINAGNYLSALGNEYTIEGPNTDVKFEAGQTIRLEPGFTAKQGSSFIARCAPVSYATSTCLPTPSGMRLAAAATHSIISPNTNTSIALNSNFRIAPNPSSGIFALHLQNIKEEFTYEVSDMYGRRLLNDKSKLAETKIDLSGQPQGIYVVSAFASGQQWVQKICKQ
jgi:hypothetical protein